MRRRVAQPLTIVHVVFSSRLAGGERHCVDLANAQARRGHRVHVVGMAGAAVEGVLAPEVRFHGLQLPLLRGWRLARRVAALGADVCHGHLGPACKAVAAVGSAARIGTLHVGYKPHHHARLDGLVCVNQAQYQGLPGQRDSLARVIYNWAPERPARPAPAAGLREQLGLAPQDLLVGSVGRLHRSKGMDLLVEAFKAHAPADASLVILGEGEELADLQQRAATDGRIRLLGYRDDVDHCLAAFDLFVSPSREEAFPLAILEAMRAGCPVLSTATQGPREMLAGQRARLAPVGDAAALGQALSEELQGLRGLAREQRRVRYATAAYDRDTAVQRVIDFYGDVIALRDSRQAEYDEAEHALNV